ncbi:velvet factor-domain-containing protein [Microdochium trichocladiopsis]|uniref:Velvet factor-domain-containing protein n=1 Tax=Microdochium trichocladiopsis TaxID=1682393 RepID=A0A9P8YB02_9PEZI|nr:velvet factor-domain-containing protein [Microdochium trichocladiopsis]KAH7035076.1 velvet factor-domain-containing protein [Microdochium trichocladiopsis]
MASNRGASYALPPIREQLGAALPLPQGPPPLPHASHPSQASHAAHAAHAPRPSISAAPPQPQAQIQATGSPPREFSGTNGNYKYTLVVEQQPQRARMCGFGDKDRRPITPPPCVKVVVTDARNGKEFPPNDLAFQQFVLHVELWSEDGTREVSMVKHATTAPSIGTGTIMSFQDAIETQTTYRLFNYTRNADGTAYSAQAAYPPSPPAYPTPPSAATQGYGYPTQVRRDSVPSILPRASYGSIGAEELPAMPAHAGQPPLSLGRMSMSQPNTSCTRNLLGSISMSATRLVDREDKVGIWFVLQDLSVRTEGIFRLRFSFIDLLAHRDGPNGQKVCPILATQFSEPFQVYSAKKFPGVCESTALSRKFAIQGVKIPIRKDGDLKKGKKRQRDEDDEDEDNDDED